ncbi:MAG: YciI family protein [Bacteroidota bacterium]
MKKYLLLLHDEIESIKKLSPKEMEDLIQAHMAWAEDLAKNNLLIEGEGLEEKSILITGKEATVKDGSFLEAREMIGGFYYLQAESLENVIEIAKACPCHLWGGTTEIRPIAAYEG